MAEPADASARRPRTLPLVEARMRFQQIVRLADLTSQITVVTDAGRPVAAVVPVDMLHRQDRADDGGGREQAAAGWMRRIEKVRDDLRQEHAALQLALAQAWARLDEVRPPGVDSDVDALRAAHADLRRPR